MIPDAFMLGQWEFMLEIVAKQRSMQRYKIPLLFEISGKLQGYGLAHPKPGKLRDAYHMAERIRIIAYKLENTNELF